MSKLYKKNKTFFDYTPKYRKKETYRVKNEIRRYNLVHGTNYSFVSYDMIDEQGYVEWVDLCFISKKDKRIFYNAEAITCTCKLIDDVSTQAYDDAFNKYPDVFWNDERASEVFGYAHKRKLEIVEEKPNTYEEYCVWDYFRCGVGLQLVIDTKSLTRDILDEHVQKFLDNGEVSWKSLTPAKNVSYKRILNTITY